MRVEGEDLDARELGRKLDRLRRGNWLRVGCGQRAMNTTRRPDRSREESLVRGRPVEAYLRRPFACSGAQDLLEQEVTRGAHRVERLECRRLSTPVGADDESEATER